jgi:hypothetical protein
LNRVNRETFDAVFQESMIRLQNWMNGMADVVMMDDQWLKNGCRMVARIWGDESQKSNMPAEGEREIHRSQEGP